MLFGKRSLTTKLLSLFLGGIVPLQGYAGVIFSTEENGVHSQTFYIDSGDTSDDFIDLEFGSTVDAKMRYDVVGDNFQINRDTDFSGNELQNLRIENLSTAPTCDAAAAGKIYFNTLDVLTYTCDGAGTWNPLENALNATIEFPVVQARRTTSYTLTTSYADIDLDTTDLENDTTTLDHDDTFRDRIDIGATAMYQIIYGYTAGGTATGTHEARARVRVNDTTVLPGSASVNKNYQGEFSTTSASFLANLSDGDFISLQLQRDATTDATQDEIYFSIIKLEGIKGEKGDPGSSGPTIDDETFTIDNDDTGGALSLIFGQTLNESLTWDSLNARFNLSDDLEVTGEILQTGNTVTLDSDDTGGDLTVQFGETLNETFAWNSSNSQFEVSDDLSLNANELVDARIENRTVAPTCDGAASGRMYHNTVDTFTYVCDGSGWVQIDANTATLGDMLAARYRDTSTTDLNAAATDNIVPWDTEDFEDAAAFTHDTVINNSRVQVLADGKYHVSGAVSVENAVTNNFRYNGRVKFRVNGVTVLPMRFQPGYIRMTSGQTETSLVFSTVLDLNANDYFEVLVDRENTTAGVANMISGQSSLSVVQLKAPQGPAGPTGATGSAGADGDITWEGAWVSQNYTTNQAVSYQGSTYVCILDTTASQNPSDGTYWELMASKGDPGSVGAGTSAETFTLDDDNTGGDVSLRYGTTNNETITWDNTNAEFDISDNLDINETGQVIEIGDGTATDSFITFDDGTDRQLGWDDSAGNFSTFGSDIESECGPYGIFWAERGTVVSNASWSLGNGQTPWGSPMGCSGTIRRLAATCTGAIGTSLGAEVRINDISTACNVSIPTTVGGVANTSCNVAFGANDVVGVYSQTETGAWTECVGTFWVKYD